VVLAEAAGLGTAAASAAALAPLSCGGAAADDGAVAAAVAGVVAAEEGERGFRWRGGGRMSVEQKAVTFTGPWE
jgi:hypothetical protein